MKVIAFNDENLRQSIPFSDIKAQGQDVIIHLPQMGLFKRTDAVALPTVLANDRVQAPQHTLHPGVDISGAMTVPDVSATAPTSKTMETAYSGIRCAQDATNMPSTGRQYKRGKKHKEHAATLATSILTCPSSNSAIALGLAATQASVSPWAGILSEHNLNVCSAAKGGRKRNNQSKARHGDDMDGDDNVPLHWHIGKQELQKLELGLDVERIFAEGDLQRMGSEKSVGSTTRSNISRFSIAGMLDMVDKKMFEEERLLKLKQALEAPKTVCRTKIDIVCVTADDPEYASDSHSKFQCLA